LVVLGSEWLQPKARTHEALRNGEVIRHEGLSHTARLRPTPARRAPGLPRGPRRPHAIISQTSAIVPLELNATTGSAHFVAKPGVSLVRGRWLLGFGPDVGAPECRLLVQERAAPPIDDQRDQSQSHRAEPDRIDGGAEVRN